MRLRSSGSENSLNCQPTLFPAKANIAFLLLDAILPDEGAARFISVLGK
jgi:hypothetical protein